MNEHSDAYDDHKLRIVEQFTRQATPFSTAPGITDKAALQLIIEARGACREDTVLDVACGPDSSAAPLPPSSPMRPEST